MEHCADKIIFNIGKQALKSIVDPISLTKVEYITSSECTGEGCLYYNTDNEHAKLYCSSFCPKASVVKPVVKRLVNLNSFNGPVLNPRGQFTPKPINWSIRAFIIKRKARYKNKIRLSLSQIKQMLSLYSICDSNGIIKSISKTQMANAIGCTEKTIENNNILLEKVGFISIFPREKGKLSIIINNYREQHKKNHGGYLVMSKDMLSLLMEIKDVNSLRLAIPAILNNDMNSLLNRGTKFSVKDIRKLLPDYIYTRKAISKIIAAFSSLSANVFKWELDADVFIVDIDKSVDGKTIKKESAPVYENEIIGSISEKYSGIDITEDTIKDKLSADIDDLVAMSFEFGVDVVKTFSVEAFSTKETIKSFGAYVRKLICSFYLDGRQMNVA